MSKITGRRRRRPRISATTSAMRLKEEAQTALALAVDMVMIPPLFGSIAETYAQLGRIEEARAEAAEVLRIQPDYSIGATTRRIMGFKSAEDAEHFFDGLRKAGLPE